MMARILFNISSINGITSRDWTYMYIHVHVHVTCSSMKQCLTHLNKVPPAFLSNLYERVTRHVLYSIMRFYSNTRGYLITHPLHYHITASAQTTELHRNKQLTLSNNTELQTDTTPHPSLPCINSNSLFTTVFRNFQ